MTPNNLSQNKVSGRII